MCLLFQCLMNLSDSLMLWICVARISPMPYSSFEFMFLSPNFFLFCYVYIFQWVLKLIGARWWVDCSSWTCSFALGKRIPYDFFHWGLKCLLVWMWFMRFAMQVRYLSGHPFMCLLGMLASLGPFLFQFWNFRIN